MKTNIALIVGPNCDMEMAIRFSLEYWGARVVLCPIGRPNNLVSVLNGEDLYPDTDYILFCFHGSDGKFVMPELGKEIYGEGEIRENFGPDEIKIWGNFTNSQHVLSTGCSHGCLEMGEAFLNAGGKSFIASEDYPEGSAALMFVLRFFYEILQNKKTMEEAFTLSQKIDKETMTFKLFESKDHKDIG